MANDTYRQCTFQQISPSGFFEYVAWIPSDEVRIGRVVRLDGVKGNWKIISAGLPRDKDIVESYNKNSRKNFGSIAPSKGAEIVEKIPLKK